MIREDIGTADRRAIYANRKIADRKGWCGWIRGHVASRQEGLCGIIGKQTTGRVGVGG